MDATYDNENGKLLYKSLSFSRSYVASIDDACLAEVTKFMAQHPYNEHLFTGTFAVVNPATWWKSGEKLGIDGNLIKVAF